MGDGLAQEGLAGAGRAIHEVMIGLGGQGRQRGQLLVLEELLVVAEGLAQRLDGFAAAGDVIEGDGRNILDAAVLGIEAAQFFVGLLLLGGGCLAALGLLGGLGLTGLGGLLRLTLRAVQGGCDAHQLLARLHQLAVVVGQLKMHGAGFLGGGQLGQGVLRLGSVEVVGQAIHVPLMGQGALPGVFGFQFKHPLVAFDIIHGGIPFSPDGGVK